MDLQLEGKKALVTGSTAGIGFATARALAAEGAAVVVNGRTQERVDAAIGKIRKAHAKANVTGIASDVSNAAGCAKVTQAVGKVDILVNNMGIFEPKPFEKIPDEDWLHFFEANVMSGVRLSRHYLAGMREKNWGRIVFVSSESAVQIPAEMVHYGMTKTAQVAVARGIAES
ncbi:MAG: SDR family oxidoreductase, partial [Candidatus Acidiferrales bacterium]